MRAGHIAGEDRAERDIAAQPGRYHGTRDRHGAARCMIRPRARQRPRLRAARSRAGDQASAHAAPDPRGRHAAGAAAAVRGLSLICPTAASSPDKISASSLQQAAVNTVLAAGMTFVILTGGIDLSVGSILAAAAMAGADRSPSCPSLGAVGVPAAVLTGLGLRRRQWRPDRAVAPATLHRHAGLAHRCARPRAPARRGHDGLQSLNSLRLHRQRLADAHSRRRVGAVALGDRAARHPGSWLVLRRTVLGVHIYAVGGNESAARLAGIKVWAVLIFVYGVSGLAGRARRRHAGGAPLRRQRPAARPVLRARRHHRRDPRRHQSFVGGIGSIWGTLVGALIIAVLSNGLILVGVSDIWQYVIKGLVIIGAVALDRYRLQGSART